ncbi:MAG: family 78 glycoside hydrolase catalytic domain, partial [Bacteroidales bacterium]|nr:family 78 glycoside hydrolase catalytic domain [Bacteroidales bacterium]
LMTAFDLKTEYKETPFIDEKVPRFSWILKDEGRGQYQQAYQLIVSSSAELLTEADADCWNSGKVESSLMSQIEYEGKPLEKTTLYFWKVRCWDKDGKPGSWSEAAIFETGLMENQNWQAKWIGYDLTHLGKGKIYHLPPSPYLRKQIQLDGNIRSARLYVTALGVYDFIINGEKVGNDFLNPGWTNYDKRVNYQAYDVTDYLSPGTNVLGSVLSEGWYAGYLGYALLVGLPQVKNFYGKVPKLLAQLEVVYDDGQKEYFVTDNSWKASKGPLLESDILEGETYDARLELTGWESPEYNDEKWNSVTVYDFPDIEVHLHPGMPIRVIERIKPVNITKRPEGYIFDMGQNFAGIVELNVKGKAGEKVILTFGEMLHQDGRLMTENLRMARATDTYILKGDPEGERWQPRFTFHGFKYVQISGLSNPPDENTLTGLALSSDHGSTSSFVSGSDMINKLFKNINWTQLSNFLDVPTDCPQRDERLGWTGDAQVYVNSAMINRDVASFFTKWIGDLNDDQWETGAYPNFAPTPYIRPKYDFSPGWMEAGIICPYHMYQSYGDSRILEKYWPNMERFMDFCKNRAGENLVFEEGSFEDIIPKGGFGDWLSLGKKTPPDLLASLYFGYCSQLMEKMAVATGKEERASYYRDLFEKIRTGIFSHYKDADGIFKCNESAYGDGSGYIDGNLGFEGHTQTSYANALYMNFYTREEEAKAGQFLVDLIKENDGKIAAGFLGTKPMLPALSKTGHTELAYDLFLKTEYPSWGFEIVNGATTIWERWNSYTHEDGFGGERNASMNSFNHYAFGAVCEWMFENAAGIKAASPAYRSITIRPETDKRLGYLEAEYQSISGTIFSGWRFEDNGLSMNVTVPVNVSAVIYVPAASVDDITESGNPVSKSGDLDFVKMDEGYAVFNAGSGKYSFFVQK